MEILTRLGFLFSGGADPAGLLQPGREGIDTAQALITQRQQHWTPLHSPTPPHPNWCLTSAGRSPCDERAMLQKGVQLLKQGHDKC